MEVRGDPAPLGLLRRGLDNRDFGKLCEIAGGSGNFQLVYGTGSTCGTGQVNLTGAYNLTAQAGLVVGSGIAPALVIPTGNDVCVITSAAVQMSGSIAYAQP